MKKFVAILLVLVLCVSAFAQAEETWTCPNCGTENTGDFCSGCEVAKPTAVKVGDIITFGTWAGEPIEWQVLEDRGDGTYVLLSVKGLDARPYNTEDTDVTWETCSLRAWLNGDFYEEAFAASEKEKIVLSTVENPDNKVYGTKGGNTTQDYVYLLSLDEVGRYFNVDPYGNANYRSDALICRPTAYAKNNGAYTNKAGACWWWLRSPGGAQGFAARVSVNGSVNYDGFYVYGNGIRFADGCERPVVCVCF